MGSMPDGATFTGSSDAYPDCSDPAGIRSADSGVARLYGGDDAVAVDGYGIGVRTLEDRPGSHCSHVTALERDELQSSRTSNAAEEYFGAVERDGVDVRLRRDYVQCELGR